MCGGFRWGREGIDPLPALFCNLAGTRFLRGMAPFLLRSTTKKGAPHEENAARRVKRTRLDDALPGGRAQLMKACASRGAAFAH